MHLVAQQYVATIFSQEQQKHENIKTRILCKKEALD